MKRLIPMMAVLLGLILALAAWWLAQDPDEQTTSDPADVPASAQETTASDEDGRQRSRVADAADARDRQTPDKATTIDEAPPAPPAGVDVLVIDAGGAACGGVVVHLQEVDLDGSWTASVYETDGTSGIATIPVLAPEDAPEAATATLGLPFEPRVSAPIDPTQPTASPLRIELPPSGRVVVEIVDVDGRPVDGVEDAVLRIREHDDELLPNRDREDPVDTFVRPVAGEATFPHVGLGLALIAIVAGRNESERSARIVFDGPSEVGAEVRVRAVLGHPRPIVTGRLLTPDGDAVAGAEIFGDVLPEHGDHWRSRHDGIATTDESGRFRLALDVSAERGRGRMLRLGRQVTAAGGLRERTEIVTQELPGSYGTTEIDLGDLVSAAGMLIVAGVVLDPAGRPVEGAKVTALRAGEERLRRVRDVPETITDAEGRFELRGPPPTSQVSVAVAADGLWLGDAPVVDVGATEVQVRVTEAGGLAGSVAPLEGLAPESLRFFVHGDIARNGEFDWGQERLQMDVGEDGHFARGNLRPGIGSVTLQTGWGTQTTVLTIDDVRIVAGETCRDPRLQAIDLSKVVRPIRLKIRDPDGARIPHAEAHHRPAESTDDDDRVWNGLDQTDTGDVTILSPASQCEVVVVAPGFKSVARVLAAGDHDIRLERATMTEIQIVLRRDGPFPKTPHYVSLEMKYLGPPGSTGVDEGEGSWEDPRGLDLWEARFDAQRQVTVKAWDPGRYQVVLLIWVSSVDSASGSYVKTDPAQPVVELGSDGSKARIELGFDAEDYARIMSRERPVPR